MAALMMTPATTLALYRIQQALEPYRGQIIGLLTRVAQIPSPSIWRNLVDRYLPVAADQDGPIYLTFPQSTASYYQLDDPTHIGPIIGALNATFNNLIGPGDPAKFWHANLVLYGRPGPWPVGPTRVDPDVALEYIMMAGVIDAPVGADVAFPNVFTNGHAIEKYWINQPSPWIGTLWGMNFATYLQEIPASITTDLRFGFLFPNMEAAPFENSIATYRAAASGRVVHELNEVMTGTVLGTNYLVNMPFCRVAWKESTAESFRAIDGYPATSVDVPIEVMVQNTLHHLMAAYGL
jgi:hypothetical protein